MILSLDFQVLKKQLNFPVTGLSLSLFLTFYIHRQGRNMVFWLVVARENIVKVIREKKLERSNVCFMFQESISSLASSKGGSSSSSSSSKSISYSWPRRNIELIISFSLSIWNLSSLGVSGITHAMKLVTVNTTNWNTNTKARRAASRCQYCLE